MLESNEVIVPVMAAQSFSPPSDGVFMSTALYRRYQQMLADYINLVGTNTYH